MNKSSKRTLIDFWVDCFKDTTKFKLSDFLDYLNNKCDLFIFDWGLLYYEPEPHFLHIWVNPKHRGKWKLTDALKVLQIIPKPVIAPIQGNKLAVNLVKRVGFTYIDSIGTVNLYLYNKE